MLCFWFYKFFILLLFCFSFVSYRFVLWCLAKATFVWLFHFVCFLCVLHFAIYSTFVALSVCCPLSVLCSLCTLSLGFCFGIHFVWVPIFTFYTSNEERIICICCLRNNITKTYTKVLNKRKNNNNYLKK